MNALLSGYDDDDDSSHSGSDAEGLKQNKGNDSPTVATSTSAIKKSTPKTSGKIIIGQKREAERGAEPPAAKRSRSSGLGGIRALLSSMNGEGVVEDANDSDKGHSGDESQEDEDIHPLAAGRTSMTSSMPQTTQSMESSGTVEPQVRTTPAAPRNALEKAMLRDVGRHGGDIGSLLEGAVSVSHSDLASGMPSAVALAESAALAEQVAAVDAEEKRLLASAGAVTGGRDLLNSRAKSKNQLTVLAVDAKRRQLEMTANKMLGNGGKFKGSFR